MASFYHTNSKNNKAYLHIVKPFLAEGFIVKNAQKASIYKFSMCKHGHVFSKNTIKHAYWKQASP